MFSFLRPAPHIARINQKEIDEKYPFFRRQILEATFLGYATFYLVRNNLPVVMKEMGESIGYSPADTADFLLATAISYGLGKFLMGALSDRSNPRYFMPIGLVLTAIFNLMFGSMHGYWIHLSLWTLNGLVQGMGWPPCGRSLGHWYSVRERGTTFAVWNIAHNIGGGLVGIVAAYSASLFGWEYAFYYPAFISLRMAVYLLFTLRDTPQSLGLPSIEEYRNDYPEEKADHERELSTREIIVDNVLLNKYIWLFAAANFFVYIIRYSLIDWGPNYLKAVKNASLEEGGGSTFIFEFAGIGSTILMGWVSDKFEGRRGMISLVCMIPILFAYLGIILTPPGMLWLDFSLFAVIGFFIYPPVMLLGVSGLDFTSKKAVGAAAGFIGFAGYLGRASMAKVLGIFATAKNWDAALYSILACAVLAIVVLAFTWKLKPRG